VIAQTPDRRGRVAHRTNARGERFCNTCSNRNGFLPPEAFAKIRKPTRDYDEYLAHCRVCESIRAVLRVDRRRQRMDEATRAAYRKVDNRGQVDRRRIERDKCVRDAREALRVLIDRGMTQVAIVHLTGISDTTLHLIRTDPTHRPYPRTAHALYRAAYGGTE